jgi:hypothetical protein
MLGGPTGFSKAPWEPLPLTSLSAAGGNHEAGHGPEAGRGAREVAPDVAQLEPEDAPGRREGPSQLRGTY